VHLAKGAYNHRHLCWKPGTEMSSMVFQGARELLQPVRAQAGAAGKEVGGQKQQQNSQQALFQRLLPRL